MSETRVKQDGTEYKDRVEVPPETFFPAYKVAMKSNMKLPDFAKQIGQAPATIQQRVAKANKILKEGGKQTLHYLSNSTGISRGRKSMTADQLAALLGD